MELLRGLHETPTADYQAWINRDDIHILGGCDPASWLPTPKPATHAASPQDAARGGGKPSPPRRLPRAPRAITESLPGSEEETLDLIYN